MWVMPGGEAVSRERSGSARRAMGGRAHSHVALRRAAGGCERNVAKASGRTLHARAVQPRRLAGARRLLGCRPCSAVWLCISEPVALHDRALRIATCGLAHQRPLRLPPRVRILIVPYILLSFYCLWPPQQLPAVRHPTRALCDRPLCPPLPRYPVSWPRARRPDPRSIRARPPSSHQLEPRSQEAELRPWAAMICPSH